MFIRFLGFIFIFLIGFQVSAQTQIDEIFHQLKNNPRSYEDKGSICEEVAKVLLEKQFPAPQYKIVVGIAYGDLDKVIGELDEVIIDTRINKAIQILEVKCWKDLNAGHEKALEQRDRFLKSIQSTKELYFSSTSTQEDFDQITFKGISIFKSIGQKGALAAGFDLEFPFTMKELMDLRVRLIQCAQWGESFCK